ncbi:MAG: type II secretion system F family protein [Armatimonadota bacterium]|nr:MAG: type II secretion system F family protein [Armatimonadota bacterium]
MQTFSYEARTETGEVVRGRLDAETERGAVEKIRQMGYWVLRVKQARRREGLAWHQFLARGYFSFIFHRVNAKALAIWYRSFSDLLGAGMNLHEAAATLAERTSNRTLRQVTREIAEQAMRGEPLSPVLDHYPSVFPLYAKALVQTGEETGLLNDTMEQLAAFHDSIYEIQMAYRTETFYPKIVLALFILIPPIPQAVAGETLGSLTFDWWKYLQLVAERVGYWGVALIALWFAWRLLMQFPPVRQGWDRVKLILPWVGGIVRRHSLARWARSMAMLIRAGVPLRRGLEAAASATGNEAMAAAMRVHIPRVQTGEPMSSVMVNSREFPDQAIDMVLTGERSGNIERMLDKMADYYEAEAAVASKQTAVTAGVAFYLLVAFMVGLYVISFWIGYFAGYDAALSGAFE